MTSGRGTEQRMEKFDAAFSRVQKDLAAQRFAAAHARLRRMNEAHLFPESRRWQYHAMEGHLLHMLGELDAALPHLRASWNIEGAPHAVRVFSRAASENSSQP